MSFFKTAMQITPEALLLYGSVATFKLRRQKKKKKE